MHFYFGPILTKLGIFVDTVYPVLDVPANRQLQYRAFLTCLCYESLSSTSSCCPPFHSLTLFHFAEDTNSVEELLIRKKGLDILFNFVQKLAEGRCVLLQFFSLHMCA